MKDKKQLKVNAIKDGTVIDHIPAKSLFKVISILNLDKIETPITFGTNLESKRLGSKAMSGRRRSAALPGRWLNLRVLGGDQLEVGDAAEDFFVGIFGHGFEALPVCSMAIINRLRSASILSFSSNVFSSSAIRLFNSVLVRRSWFSTSLSDIIITSIHLSPG